MPAVVPRGFAMNLTNQTYLVRLSTRSLTEIYFRDEAGWVKMTTRNRRFRATAEQVLNHLLPALAGLEPSISVAVEHYEDPALRPLSDIKPVSRKHAISRRL